MEFSGGGFTVMQQALVDVTHKPFPELMATAVLGRIGMTHSTYNQPLPSLLMADEASPYNADGSLVPGGAHTYPEMAAAGLWTTPCDLAKYIIEVQRSLAGKANHVRNSAMATAMLTPGKNHWGLGVETGGSDKRRMRDDRKGETRFLQSLHGEDVRFRDLHQFELGTFRPDDGSVEDMLDASLTGRLDHICMLRLAIRKGMR